MNIMDGASNTREVEDLRAEFIEDVKRYDEDQQVTDLIETLAIELLLEKFNIMFGTD